MTIVAAAKIEPRPIRLTKLTSRPSDVPEVLDERELTECFKRITEARILVFVSPFPGSLSGATHALLDQKFRRTTACRVEFVPAAGTPTLSELQRALQEENSPRFAVVDLGTTGAPRHDEATIESELEGPFLSSLFAGEQVLCDLQALLRNAKALVLCRVSSRRLNEQARRLAKVRRTVDDPRFELVSVPFLRPFLRFHCPSEAEVLVDQIERQRTKGLWGDPEDDFELYDQLFRFTDSQGKLDAKRLAAEIADRGPGGSRQNDPTSELAATIQSTGAVELEALFCATFFPDLAPHDFQTLMQFFLEGRSITIWEEELEVDSEGKERIVTRSHIRSLLEIWHESPDRFLAQAGLGFVLGEGQRINVEFKEVFWRPSARPYFLRNYALFLESKFDQVFRQGLLFDATLTPSLVSSVVQFLSEMFEVDPRRMRRSWLGELLLGAWLATEVEPPNEATPAEALRWVTGRQIQINVLTMVRKRSAQLLGDLLSREALIPGVRDALETLFETSRHGEAHSLVRELIRTPCNFDLYYWLRRLLDESPSMIATAAYGTLLHEASVRGVGTYQFFQQISAWLPASEVARRPSERFALRLLLEYSANALRWVAPDSWGTWPPRFPLFATFSADDLTETERRARLLVDWLLHPALVSVVWTEGEDPATALWRLRADILESWYGILLGLTAKPKSEVLAVAQTIVTAIADRLSSHDHGHLLNGIRSLRPRYLSAFKDLKPQEAQKRALLQGRLRNSLAFESAVDQWRKRHRVRSPQGAHS
jgi:hypothetical protein